MIWYSNLRKQGTTGWIWIIGFAPWVNVHNSSCLVYAKFNGLSCMVPGYRFWRFWGGLSLYSVRAHLGQKTPAILKWLWLMSALHQRQPGSLHRLVILKAREPPSACHAAGPLHSSGDSSPFRLCIQGIAMSHHRSRNLARPAKSTKHT